MSFFARLRLHSILRIGDRSAVLDLARGRVMFLGGAFALLYCILAVRVLDISVLHGAFLQDNFEDAAPIERVADVMRGHIYDRNGALLATTLDMPSLYADPALISDPENAAKQLHEIFSDLSYSHLNEKLSSDKRFVWIKRFITPEDYTRVMAVGEPGLAVRYEPKRFYPMKGEFSHVLGVVDVDQKGLSGLERSMNGVLSKGEDVHLTMDARLQHGVYKAVQNAMTEFSAIGGSGVVMDIHDGAILAAVSLPDFNPHQPRMPGQDSRYFNRLTQGVYELGSVFKIFSTAAFLEEHPKAGMDMVFDAREPIKIGRFRISDYHAQKRLLTIPEVFMYSSNIGSAMMGQAVGGDRLQEFYADLGLLEVMDFELLEVGSPLLPQRWGEVQTMTASYGHGIAVSPMHVVGAMAPIVNGGFAVRPHFVEKDISGDMQQKLRVLSGDTSYKMRQLLRLVVMEGTARKADVEGYQVGGKTGTADKVKAGGGYDRKNRISSFLGAFPMDDPQYVIFVMIDEPKGTKKSFGYATAGWVAAPAMGSIVQSIVNILGIKPYEMGPEVSHPFMQYVAVDG